VTDTLNAVMLEVEQLHSRLTEREFQIETLNTDLARTNKELEEAVRNRDSLSFLGIQMNKALYNTIIWFIILGLIALSVVLIMMFRRTHQLTKEVREELETVREEFELYRKSSREKYEKLVVSHHNEILKLKNN
jgi:tetrahydromethanopterin S-methyltransferase subunit B